jgi:acyl-CoA thioesterase I
MLQHIGLLIALLLTGMLAGCAQQQDSANNDAGTEGETASRPPAGEAEPQRTANIVFFGNSLTAGYMLEPAEAFPALIQQKIDSLGLPYKTVNAGLSGETTAGGVNRVDWILRQPVDIFVLELGANDGLRGIDPQETRRNLLTIIEKVRTRYPDAQVLLLGMQVPPSMGGQYARAFSTVFPEVAREADVPLVPFLLEGIGGVARLNLPDGIHPTAEGHKIMAETVWQGLQPLL